jgi:SAM-dependent methyltransferase
VGEREYNLEAGMGLRIKILKLIEEIKPLLPENPSCYVMGTEDCRFTYSQVLKRYSGKKGKGGLCDLEFAFKSLGFGSVTTVDMNERADIRTDLTVDVPAEYCEKADLVCELGTLEHIFDAKSAILNMNRFLKKGGVIFHMCPVSSYRHGFVNFNPAFLDSLYLGSGYELVMRTMNMTVYNPLYIINIEDIPKPGRSVFSAMNKLLSLLRIHAFNFNLPPQKDMKGSRFWKFTEFCMTHFGPPKHMYYCCAYRKTKDGLKIPYDIWE